ncbi:MAG TPA: hypothetical protein P5555_12530 [Candidatus Paceibacterota bacterium]|nr:hypothetical protein [Verrucomicrobiota bacterium]HRZ46007.1 hypothetical protein [Candidatus Paceibacterota bacterium]HRZ93416.1 hypothetical protein [Candidatus Paceibacterota bacterium]
MRRMWVTWVAAGALAWAGCGPAPRPAAGGAGTNSASEEPAPAGSNPLTTPVDYVGVAGRAPRTASKVVDLASLRQAIQAFQAGEDRWPKDLGELVKEGYLPRMPSAPAGMRFIYNPQNGQLGVGPAPAPAP